MSNRSFHFANRFQTMISAIRGAPLRVLFLAVAVAMVGLMTVTDLTPASPVHAQEQAVTATRNATGESPPARPTDLQALAEPDSVSLTWTASTDQTVTHYAVLRRDRDKADAGVFKVIDGNAGFATSYADRSVSPEGSYVYRVKAVSPTGVSQWSSYARADIPADPEDLAPSGLSAKFVSGDDGVIEGVALAWNAPAADAESVTGYEILRAVGDGDLATLAAGTGSAGTTYADDTATEAGESYAYRVKALRGEEASQPSDRAVAFIPKVTTVDPQPGIAEEQSGTTAWVSNTAQTLASNWISLGNTDKRHSQGFRTGAETGGYSLGSVGVYVRDEDLESGETFTVHIYTANATGAIDTLVHTLISPDSYADGAVNLFTAPADATLAANTDYLVVFEATGNEVGDFQLGRTDSTSEDSGSATGWSIEDSRRFDNSTSSGIFVISVNAAAEASAVVWSATLTVGDVSFASKGYQDPVGTLSPASFDIGETSYTVTHLSDNDDSGGLTGIKITFQPALTVEDASGLTLNLGDDASLLFADAAPTVLPTVSQYQWPLAAPLGWSTGDSVALTLTMSASDDATLSALSLSDVTLSPSFAADTLAYTGSVGNSVTSTTVTATANHDGATVAIVPADADDTADGHQVALDVGETVISVTVTAEDGTTTQTYAVTVTRAVAAEQNEAVWSATFTPTTRGNLVGCSGDTDQEDEFCSNRLTDNTFDYDGTTYTVTDLYLTSTATLEFALIPNPTATTIAELTLNIGDSPFPLSSATESGSLLTWASSGLTWAADSDSISVSLTEAAAAPVVSSVEVTSEPGDDDTYAIGDTIQVTVTFDQAVTVTGAPRIKLRVGGGDAVHQKWADYTSGSGNEALLFAYTVQADDFDDNGIYIAADELELNGGTIQSSGGTDANLDYPLQGGQSGHNVDGVRPTPEFAVTSVDGSSVIIVFSESLSGTTAPASAFTIGVDTGTAPVVSSATATGNSVTLGLASALTSGQVVTVAYVDATAGNDAAAVQDAAGNDAANFTQTVTNNAAIVVSADWGLIPTGLGAGAEFRLLFRTSGTRNAASTDIADYNTFVQTAAAAGHADIQSHSSTFRVLGSTADVDARDNTFTTYTADDKGVLIYWLGGAKVADDYEDFYDGSWSNADGGKDEHGADRAPPVIAPNVSGTWTGSASNGTEAITGNDAFALGASDVRIGQPLDSTLSGGNTLVAAFYGLSGVFRVSDQVVTNTAPEFTSDPDFSTNENQAATFQVTAEDADAGDAVTYAITGGADLALFSINATSGLLAIPTSVDHENPADADGNNTYLVTVTATGGTDARALTTDQAITVTVNDVDEPPSFPAAPTVSAVDGSSDSLSVTWTAPGNSGKPDIESYDLQYRKGTTGNYIDGPQDVTDTTTIIGGLDADSLYQVRVRTTNDEGDSLWSSAGSGTTNALAGLCLLPTGPLWSACLTVGEIDSTGRYGYQGSLSIGSLAPATFDVGTTTYTVTHLFDNDNVGGTTYVRIILSPILSQDDAGNLTLHLGDDTSLSFGDATYSTGTGISRHLWTRSAALGWSTGETIVVGITQEEQANTAPSFQSESAAREVAENSAAGSPVGGPVTATDGDDDTLTYTLEGTDAASFDIDSESGQIQTETGVTYDHESQPEYSVTVKADDGNGGTDTIAVTIDIIDVEEPPSAPAAPTVSAVSGTTDSLEVAWTAPVNTGKPAIESYDLQYRKGTTGDFTDGPQDVTGLTATIGGLEADSAYQVQVRATNDEGDSVWSSAGSGTTNAPAGCGTLPTGRLWSACLTAGAIGSGGPYGYQASDSTGSLAPATFDVGTTTYTVTHLFDNDNVGGTTYVRIILSPILSQDDAGNLTLHLGDDASFSFADATYSTGTDWSRYSWDLQTALGWSTGDAIVVGITQKANTAPSFQSESATREVAENSAAGVDVGGPVTATDTDDDTLTYTLEGTDAASFTIDASTGQIQTETGVTYDYESQLEYSVTVKADDGKGGTDTIAVAIDIIDVEEPPSAPAAPTVSAVSDSSDSLSVSWTAPGNSGRPAIDSYDLQYRKGTTGNYIDGPQDVTVTTTIIGGLDEDSAYQVQVRATNDEGDGAWSSPGSGSTNAPAEEMAETTVPADWSLIPSDLGPGDSFRLLFIGTTSRNASDSDIDVYNTFVQNLVAASGHADIKALSGTFRMLGSTEDVDARDNTGTTGTGVPIYWLGGAQVADDYADFYDGDWDEEATGRRENGDSVSIGNNWKIWTGSAEDGTEAMNDTNTESRALGNSGNHWVMQGSPNGSDSAHGPIQSNTAGRGTNRGVYGLSGVFTVSDQPTANDPPAFSSAASFSVEENQTDAGTVIAADPDAVDAVTYAVTGGADRAKFDIGESSGDLTFKDAPDHENPTDAGRNNTYMVTVTATGGTGDRAMTAEQTITVTVTDVAETPAVDDLDVSSTPKADIDTYGREETIEVTVTFDQAVNVTGTPRIRLRIGGGMQQHYRWADYDGGTGTTALRFTYVVVEGDMDTDGIYILENELELNGGAIQGVDDDVAADLDYPRQGTQSGHKVDGSLKSDNTDPAFDQESAVRGLRENTGAGEYVGDPFTATDEDGDTLTYSLEGDDAGSFVINSRTGQILTREGVTYDHEVTTEYSVTVKADDGERGDATVEVAILVIDVNEPPLAPRAPTLSDGPDDSGSLDVTWKTPDNSGRPDIESYDLRYRKTGAENWRNGPQDVTGLTATIGGLDADSDYQVQVRATNDEGDGEWSPSRSTTYPTGPVIEVDDNGDGVVDADPEVTLVLGSTVSYRVRPGRCEGYKTLTVQRMSGASEGAPPHIPVDASQEVSPMPCMGEDDPGEWQTVTLAVPLDLWLELLLETRFEASVEHSVYYRRSLTDRYSPLLLWGHLVRVLAPAPETLNPVGSLTVAPDARDYPRVTWSAVPGATGYQVQWRWGPDEEYGRVHRQEGSTYSREKRTGETAYTIPISETVPTTDEGVERSQPITVRVRPYDSKGLAVGPWREALLAERTEVRKVLAGFSLLDADGSSLAALTDGATVELSDPDGGSYAIRAELVAGELAGSVHLELSGKKRVRSTENDAPYLLAGGEGMALPAGSYTLEATAYGGPDRTYAVQHTLEVSFTVTAAASGQPGSGELNVEEDEEEETEPLTARFEGLPEAGHGGGGTPFAFQLVFSEAVSTTPEALRDHALAVTNATVEAASRVDGRSDLWEVRLTPESDAMVTVSLSPLAGCDAAGAVCTEDGRMLSVGAARVIPGPPPNSPATGQPTISGTAQVGQTLTADTTGIADEDGLDNVTFSYQWMADDTNIQGATGSTYTLADRDEGKAIKVIVSFTDDANNEESLPSAATDAVTALPGKPQSLAGKATTQEIQLAWKAPTGPAVVEYVVYRGILQNGSMNGQALSKYATIDAAGKAMTYTDGNVEEGVEYRYRVAAVNADGEGKKSTWLDITAE